jgi:hypothetical protein
MPNPIAMTAPSEKTVMALAPKRETLAIRSVASRLLDRRQLGSFPLPGARAGHLLLLPKHPALVTFLSGGHYNLQKSIGDAGICRV